MNHLVLWQPVPALPLLYGVCSDRPAPVAAARQLFAPWVVENEVSSAQIWQIEAADENLWSVAECPGQAWRNRSLSQLLAQIEYGALGHLVAHLPAPWIGLHGALLVAPATDGRATDERAADGQSARGVLIVGPKEAGKSTLACALWRAGWELLCDDFTLLDAQARAHASARRVSLRAGSRELLGDLWTQAAQTPSARGAAPQTVTTATQSAATQSAATQSAATQATTTTTMQAAMAVTDAANQNAATRSVNAGRANAGNSNAGSANAGNANAGSAGDGNAEARDTNARDTNAGRVNAGGANAGSAKIGDAAVLAFHPHELAGATRREGPIELDALILLNRRGASVGAAQTAPVSGIEAAWALLPYSTLLLDDSGAQITHQRADWGVGLAQLAARIQGVPLHDLGRGELGQMVAAVEALASAR